MSDTDIGNSLKFTKEPTSNAKQINNNKYYAHLPHIINLKTRNI